MYGLINNAIRQLTIERCGPQTWSDIAGDLGLEDRFISMNHYPDALSAQLVSRLSEAMDVSPDVVLQQLGIYWVSKASKEYSDLFSQLGPSLTTALQNLDSLHSRVALSFPDLSPPSFDCTDISSDGLTLHYYSTRHGLTSFVRGLLQGMSEAFGSPVAIATLQSRSDGSDHDVFRITYLSSDHLR